MKKLMLGNEAVARGLYEAGTAVVSSYPGTPSTEVTEFVSKYDEVYSEWAPNEKVAAEVAIGASLGGGRAACAMKHVGLNVAADPLYTVSYIGVNGGLVFIVADDPGMHSSQNEQDTRLHGRASHVPVLEPSSSQECIDFTKYAFELSEKYDTPVILRLTTRIAHSQSLCELNDAQPKVIKDYVKNVGKNLMMPAMARQRRVHVMAREEQMAKDGVTMPINVATYGDKSVGFVTSGISYQYVKEAMPNASVLKLGLVYPLPKDLIMEFAGKVDRLVIAEELEPFFENQLKSWGLKCEGADKLPKRGELSAALIAKAYGGKAIESVAEAELPNRPPVLCPGCPHRGIDYLLNKNKITAMGDIGCYTIGALPPLSAVDTCVCMGASISTAMGMEKVRGKDFARKLVSMIGDSTFIHSGITSLIDLVYNGATSTVLILDNSITGMTGHQQNPATGKNIKGEPAPKIDLEALVRSIGVKNVRVVDPFETKETEAILKEELAREELSVLIVRRPCQLILKEKKPPYYVDQNACKKCKVCLKVGCPSIENRGEGVVINDTLCVGCGMCSNVCSFGAIKKAGE